MPPKQPKIQSIDVWNSTFIVTTCKIDQSDIYKYLKNRISEEEFTERSIIKIYAGAHGYSDGRLGDRRKDLDQLKSDIAGQIIGYQDDVEDARIDMLETMGIHEKLRGRRQALVRKILEFVLLRPPTAETLISRVDDEIKR